MLDEDPMPDKLCEPMAPLDGDKMHVIQTYNNTSIHVCIQYYLYLFNKKLTDSDALVPRRVLQGLLVSGIAACYTCAGLYGVRACLQPCYNSCP